MPSSKKWTRNQKILLAALVVTAFGTIVGLIINKQSIKSTNIQRDTFSASDNAQVSVKNTHGLEPNQLFHEYALAHQTIGQQKYQIDQLTFENREIKEQYDKTVKRIEELEIKGNNDAAEALKQLRQTGNTEKLLALLIKERNRNQNAFIELNREIAAVAFLRGDIAIANYAVDQILKLDPNDLFALNQQGRIHRLKGQLNDAEESYQRVFEIAEKEDHFQAQAAALGNLGIVYQTRGALDKAEEMFKKALEIDEQMGNKEGMAADYGNLGIVYRTRGKLDNAEEMHKKALDIFIQIGSLEGQANQYGNLGLVYETRGDLTNAEENYRKALDIDTQMANKQGMAKDYGNLGNVYQTRGDLTNAE
ncbi:MAG: tetratricopeptide repeat protein, partial [Phycisphaerae bacterium]